METTLQTFTSVTLLPVFLPAGSRGALKWAVLRVPSTVACIFSVASLSFGHARLSRIDEIAHIGLNAGLHRKSLSSNVNHDNARQVLECSQTWNGCCNIVAELDRCVCQCPQLSCPLHSLRNSDGPRHSRRSRVGPDFFSRLGRIGLCSEPPTSKKKCVANRQLCIADSTAFPKNILGPLLHTTVNLSHVADRLGN